MKTIVINLEDDYYAMFEKLAERVGKNVNDYAKQSIENKTDVFRTPDASCYDPNL